MNAAGFAHRVRAFGAAAFVALAIGLFSAAPHAGAQDDGSEIATTTTPAATSATEPELRPGEAPSIIPVPHSSGDYEVQPGEPGSGEQYLVFAVIIGGLATIVIAVTLESRRKREEFGTKMPDPTTIYEQDDPTAER